jgi:hypothetical protein
MSGPAPVTAATIVAQRLAPGLLAVTSPGYGSQETDRRQSQGIARRVAPSMLITTAIWARAVR